MIIDDTESPWKPYENYDYREFWLEREYEDRVERTALNKLLPRNQECVIDLGSNYGRLAGEYKFFKSIILSDGAYSAIQQSKDRWKQRNYNHVVCDLGNTPFEKNSFDVVICVRTLHHLPNVSVFFAEARRILKPGKYLVFEFANKRNLKQLALALLRKSSRELKSINPSPVGKNIKNFHPKYIQRLLVDFGFESEEVVGVSIFRHNLIKKIVPIFILVRLDAIVQKLVGKLYLSPSIFIKAKKIEETIRAPD